MAAHYGVAWLAQGSVDIGEIHAIHILQAGDLAGVMLDFEIGLHDGNVNDFPLFGVLAFHPDAIKFKVAVMSFHEFLDDSLIHGDRLF